MLLRKLLADDPHLRVTLLEHRSKVIREEKYRARVTVATGAFENLRTFQGADTLIHLAAVTHAKNGNLYRVVNTEGTEKLLRLAKDSGVKHLVYVSTTALGDSCGAYGASKLEAEKAVERGGVPYTIVRFAEVYGGEGKEGVERLISIAKRFPVVPYITNTFLAPVYVEDAIAALRTAIYRSPENKTYIVAGPERLSFYEAAYCIASAFGKKIVCVPIPQALLQIAKRACPFLFAPDQVERLICAKDYDSRLAIQDLKFSPCSFHEGLQKCRTARE